MERVSCSVILYLNSWIYSDGVIKRIIFSFLVPTNGFYLDALVVVKECFGFYEGFLQLVSCILIEILVIHIHFKVNTLNTFYAFFTCLWTFSFWKWSDWFWKSMASFRTHEIIVFAVVGRVVGVRSFANWALWSCR